ncbi:MAG: SGNH/GDSL hydrolase family protein [Christensenellales bacterium]|jgi:hypothetical protein
MRILMLGNSFTYCHDMPQILARLTESEVISHTRGGAYLSEQLNPETEMGAKTERALEQERFDYVILQEQSIAPVAKKDAYFKSVRLLAEKIHRNGAVPILYATWAYREGSEKLRATGLSYEEMDRALWESCHMAAEKYGCLVADVGRRFTQLRALLELYEDDAYHPSEAGSLLAATEIARALPKKI